MNLHSQGIGGLMKEKMFARFSDFEHHGSINDEYGQLIDHCDQNNIDNRLSFWIETFQTMHPCGLSYK